MAAYISVPRDLTRVKSKIFMNLTKRQLICFGGGAAMGVPVFFGLKHLTGNISLSVMCMMVIMLPMFFLAMYERDGQPLEKIAGHFIETKFIRPKVRPYQTDNYYAILVRQARAEEEVSKIVFDSEEKRKKTGRHKDAAGAVKAGAGTGPEDRRRGKKK